MTQLELAIAAQENPWQDLLWFDWDYCECLDDDDDSWPEDDAEWLRGQGIIDEDGFVVDSLEFDDFNFEE